MTDGDGRRVALASTLHDPEGATLPLLLDALPDLPRRYAGLAIVATEETPERMIAPLVAAGAAVTRGPSEYREIGRRRLGAVRQAADLAPSVHLCDFDRLLHWWHGWRDELDATLARIATVDLLLLGRTARAWATHPANQVETEQAANRLVSRLYDEPVDVCSGSRGLSRRAVAYLAAHSTVHDVGTDGEWPVLLRRAGGFRCDQVLTEGLEFETADRYPDEVARAGGLAAWNAAHDRDPARWTFRTRLAADIVAGALSAADERPTGTSGG